MIRKFDSGSKISSRLTLTERGLRSVNLGLEMTGATLRITQEEVFRVIGEVNGSGGPSDFLKIKSGKLMTLLPSDPDFYKAVSFH